MQSKEAFVFVPVMYDSKRPYLIPTTSFLGGAELKVPHRHVSGPFRIENSGDKISEKPPRGLYNKFRIDSFNRASLFSHNDFC
jgi:hypothetical protein